MREDECAVVAVEIVVTVVAGLSTRRLRFREASGEGIASSISDNADEFAEESEDESSRPASARSVWTLRDDDPFTEKFWIEDANDRVR